MKFIIPLFLFATFTINAVADEKRYECKIMETSQDFERVKVSFTDGWFGGISRTRVDILNHAGKASSIHFDGSLKTPNSDSYYKGVYLESYDNCVIWPFCDIYSLRFMEMVHKFDFKALPSEMTLSLESVTGPLTNRSHDSSLLRCSVLPVQYGELNDIEETPSQD